MELVDENEGYDSEDDSNDAQQTTVVNFLAPEEIKPFSLGSSSGQVAAKPKPTLKTEAPPAFWMGKQNKPASSQQQASVQSAVSTNVSNASSAKVVNNKKRYAEPSSNDMDDMLKLLSSKQKTNQPTRTSTLNYKPLHVGGEELRDHLRRSNESDKSKKEKVASAKNPVGKEEGFKAFTKSPAASDSDQRVTETIRRSRRFDQVLDDSEFGQQDEQHDQDNCAPIQCTLDEDGPDFSRMAKKSKIGNASTASVSSIKAKKGEDIRKRFMIEKPKGGGALPGMMGVGGPAGGRFGSYQSQVTASTDSSMGNPLAQSLVGDQILRQQLVEQAYKDAAKQRKRLELPKELQFSSDDEDDEDLAGFHVVMKTKQTLRYVPDQERAIDGAKIGFNQVWHESIKREKNLIIEPPRPTVHTIRAPNSMQNQPATLQGGPSNRLPEMMEAILSNMQFNQDTHNKDKRTSHNTATAKKPEVKLASEVYTACKGPKPARPHTQRSQPEEIKQMSTVFAKKIVKKLRMPALVCNESFVVPSSTVVSGIRKSSGSVTVAPIRMQAAKFSVTEVKKITGAALIPTTKGKKKIVLRRLPKMP